MDEGPKPEIRFVTALPGSYGEEILRDTNLVANGARFDGPWRRDETEVQCSVGGLRLTLRVGKPLNQADELVLLDGGTRDSGTLETRRIAGGCILRLNPAKNKRTLANLIVKLLREHRDAKEAERNLVLRDTKRSDPADRHRNLSFGVPPV